MFHIMDHALVGEVDAVHKILWKGHALRPEVVDVFLPGSLEALNAETLRKYWDLVKL